MRVQSILVWHGDDDGDDGDDDHNVNCIMLMYQNI